jgi:hypothetical protein
VLKSRTKLAMLGLLAVMLLGSVMATTAAAEPGPFWYHRPVGEKEGTGVKLAEGTAESFTGTGGVQILDGEISGTGVEIESPSVQVKGAITNSIHQGQIKVELIYSQPKLLKPALKECNVTINKANIVVVKGHLAWKWDGTQAQLEEQPQANQVPDLLFTNVEPQRQATFGILDYRKVGTFTNLTFSGPGCGVLAGTFAVEGSEVGIPNLGLNAFNKALTVRTISSGRIQRSRLPATYLGSPT